MNMLCGMYSAFFLVFHLLWHFNFSEPAVFRFQEIIILLQNRPLRKASMGDESLSGSPPSAKRDQVEKKTQLLQIVIESCRKNNMTAKRYNRIIPTCHLVTRNQTKKNDGRRATSGATQLLPQQVTCLMFFSFFFYNKNFLC